MQNATSPNMMVAPSEIDAPTEMIEQTNDHLVDFDLKLANQDQYNCSDDNEESQISENIVACSEKSEKDDKTHKKIQQNIRKKIDARMAEDQKLRICQETNNSVDRNSFVNGSESKQPKFGTQIVNYKPDLVEKESSSSESCDKNQSQNIFSNGKRTFTGSNFANLKQHEDESIRQNDTKENEAQLQQSTANKSFFKRDHVDVS